MAKDCLHTQLKGQVNNDDLLRLNAFKMMVLFDTSVNHTLYIKNTEDFEIIFPKGEYLVTANNGTTPLTSASQRVYTIQAGAESGEIYRTLYPSHATGKDYEIQITKAKTLQYLGKSNGADGLRFGSVSTEVFKDNKVLEIINAPNILNTDTWGNPNNNIADFCCNTTLGELSSGNNKIPGSMEEMAENGWNAGRRSGRIQCITTSSRITFHGELFGVNQTFYIAFESNMASIRYGQDYAKHGIYQNGEWTYQ